MAGILRKTFAVSPSRTYVLFLVGALKPSEKHYFRLEVPFGYENNEYGVKKFYFNEIDRDASIIACIPAEMYDETGAWLHQNDTYRIWSEPDCVELIKRYSYREKRPEVFLFCVPRVIVSSLEEELTRQANINFHLDHPNHIHGTHYGQENHYCVTFKVISSGGENIVIYDPYKIYREVTIYFTDKMAVFGIGLKDY